MKKIAPYLTALIVTIFVYLTTAWGLEDIINHTIIFISTIFFTMAIAGFYSTGKRKGFFISILFSILGLSVLYYGFYSQGNWTLLKPFCFIIFFLFSLIGIYFGYRIETKSKDKQEQDVNL